MRRATKKDVNLNKLKTGCLPCMNEARRMEEKILKRNISEIKIDEIKNIISSIFKQN